jgi:hypothetical protein
MGMSNEICTDFNGGAQAWVEQFGSAPLSPTHAASLIESSLATVRVVAEAAQSLDWLEADSFTRTLQDLEANHAR